MNTEERNELRRELEAAGCPELATLVPHFCEVIRQELRSLLRREVWVATWLGFYHGDHDYCERFAVFSSRENLESAMLRAGRDIAEVGIQKYTIDAEVPNEAE